MVIGHFALAFGAKKYAPQVSLGVLVVACQLADIIMPPLVLLGIEMFEIEPGITVMMPLNLLHYPYSHSLVALALWGALFAVFYAWIFRSGTKAAIVLAVLVLSHWILDVLTHRPDVPVTMAGSARLGVGLWNVPVIAVPLEILLFGAGVWLYVRNTRPLSRRGSVGFWALIVFLLLVYAGIHLGPPLPSANAMAWSGLVLLCLIVAWALWVDRHRGSVTGLAPQ